MSQYRISFISKQTKEALNMFTFEFEARSTYEYMLILTEYIQSFELRDCVLTSEIIG